MNIISCKNIYTTLDVIDRMESQLSMSPAKLLGWPTPLILPTSLYVSFEVFEVWVKMQNWLEFCVIMNNGLFNVSATMVNISNMKIRVRKKVVYFDHPEDDHAVPNWSEPMWAKNHLSTIVQKLWPFWKDEGAGDGWILDHSVCLHLHKWEALVANIITDEAL